MLAVYAGGVPYHGRGINYQCGKCRVDAQLGYYCSIGQGARTLGASVVEAGEGGTDWCTVTAELLVFLPWPPSDP